MKSHESKSQQSEIKHKSNAAKQTEQTAQKNYSSASSMPAITHAGDASGYNQFTSQDISYLQRTIGNQAVVKIIQAKLKVSQPGDVHEQEAERVTQQIMRMPEPRVKEKKDELIQTKAIAWGAQEIDPALQKSLDNMQGGGRPLPASTRAFFEPHLGHDFSQVRVHTGEHAAATANALNAQAYTIGRNVVFGAGKFAPEANSGKRLLAHELSHVVQQQAFSSLGMLQREEEGPVIKPAPENQPLKDLGSDAKEYIDKIHKKPQLLTEDQVREAVRIQFIYLRDNFYMTDFQLIKMGLATGPLGRTDPVSKYGFKILKLCKDIENEARKFVFDFLRRSGEPLIPKEDSDYGRLKVYPIPPGY